MRISDWSSDVCSSDLAFDPLSRTEIESVNAAIKSRAAGKSLTLDVQQSRQPIGNTLAPASKCKVGICYRPEEPFDLVLVVDKAEYDRTSLLLPTKAKLVEIPVTRAAFVEKNNTIEFEKQSEEHTSELQSLMRISYAVFCLQKKQKQKK